MKKRFKRIYIEITNKCNLSCSFCHHSKRSKKEMSLEEFEKVVLDVKNYTDFVYLHVSGEPLIHPFIDSVLHICEDNGLIVQLTTNATLLEQKKDLLKVSKCIRQINVSLHSENLQNNYFDKVFKVCDELSKYMYISYRIWSLDNGKLNKKSTDIVEKIISWYHLSPEIVEKMYNEMKITIGKNLFVNKESLFEWPVINGDKVSDGYCLALKNQLAILSDGRVVPCCLDYDGEITLGNIFEQGLAQIIKSDRFVKMLNGFRANKAVEDLCRNCQYKERFK